MNRTTTLALLLGVVVTFCVIAIDVPGGFTALERRTIDMRFTSGARPPSPMSDRIVHVDIDDRAIGSLGRWPWERSRIAEAIEQLGRAGARVVALDIMFEEKTSIGEGATSTIDHDARLADALSRVPCLLAVKIHEGQLFGDDWATAQGMEERNRLLQLLAADVALDEQAALEEARITGERRRRFRLRSMSFREAAAWKAIEWSGEALPTVEAFEDLIAPNRPRSGADYPGRNLYQQVWTNHLAWRAIRPLLLPGRSRGTFRDIAPYLPFAERAASVGYVNSGDQIHADGVIRALDVQQSAPGGAALQFGLAAAALYRGLEPADVEQHGDAIVLGDVVLPLHDGRLWIDWPTSTTDSDRWLGLLGQSEDATEDAGHLTISQVIELSRSRRVQESNRVLLADMTRRILEYDGEPFDPDDLLGLEAQESAAGSYEFAFGVRPDQAQPPPLPDETDHEFNCRTWLEVSTAVREDAKRIALNETKLHDAVDDRLVFIGWTASGAAADFVTTPLGPRTPGVVVHAAIANMALTGDSVRLLEPWRRRLLIVLLGLLATVAAARFSALISGVCAAAALGLYVYAAWAWLFAAHDLVLPVVAPVVGGAGSWIACIALMAAVSQRERRRITLQFRSRVSAQLVDFLVENPDALSVSGEEREMTVMFGDLAGFTAISERLGGPTTVSTLNRYLGQLTDILVANGAYMNKFLGDGFMAFWSAFTIDPDQAVKACRGALNCQRAVLQLNEDPAFADLPPLGLRIGVATGRVVVGDCGAPPALNDYTVIGDAVNLAARLETARKQFGTQILINHRTRELLPEGENCVRPIGRIVVVGQTVPVDVYEVMPPETPPAIVEVTQRAVRAFQSSQFDDAGSALDALTRLVGPNAVAETYRDAIATAGDDFDGVLHLHEK